MTGNPLDPMRKSGPDQQRELFNMFCKVASGFGTDEVAGAAINLLVNALRQAHSTQPKALARLDEIAATAKGLLAQHYDALGRRRNIFPFHQTIEVPHFIDRDGFKK